VLGVNLPAKFNAHLRKVDILWAYLRLITLNWPAS
jgi:hypothetical protein